MDTELNGRSDKESYSISEISALLGESRTKLYRWIDAFEQAEGFRASAEERDGGKYYPKAQWTALLASQDKEFPEIEQVDVQVEPPMTGFSGLVAPTGCSSLAAPKFDAMGYRQHKDMLENQTAQRAQDMNQSVIAYAQSRMAETLADIDIAVAQVRDNAFKSMGLGGGEKD